MLKPTLPRAVQGLVRYRENRVDAGSAAGSAAIWDYERDVDLLGGQTRTEFEAYSRQRVKPLVDNSRDSHLNDEVWGEPAIRV